MAGKKYYLIRSKRALPNTRSTMYYIQDTEDHQSGGFGQRWLDNE